MWRPPSSLERTYTSALKRVWGVIEPGLGQHLPPLYVVAPHAPKERAYVVAGLGLVHATC